MSDAFWTMLGVVLPIVVVQAVQVWQTSQNAKKSQAGREEIKAQVAEVKDTMATIRTTKIEVEQRIAGEERRNIAKGIEIGKQQATGPMGLGGAK